MMSSRGILRWGMAASVLILTLACARVQPGSSRRVLVLDFQNSIQGTNYSQALAEWLTTSLAGYPRVSVVERQSVRDLINQQRVEPMSLQRLGRKSDADYLILGAISKLDQNFIVNARLFSVTTGQVVPGTSVSRSCQREDDLYPIVEPLARELAKQIKARAELQDQQAGSGAIPAASSAAPQPEPAAPNVSVAAPAPPAPPLKRANPDLKHVIVPAASGAHK